MDGMGREEKQKAIGSAKSKILSGIDAVRTTKKKLCNRREQIGKVQKRYYEGNNRSKSENDNEKGGMMNGRKGVR